MTPYVRADNLPPSQQREVLRHLRRRHTFDHTPERVQLEAAMHIYSLPKLSDKAWLRTVWVRRTKDGTIDKRFKRWWEFR